MKKQKERNEQPELVENVTPDSVKNRQLKPPGRITLPWLIRHMSLGGWVSIIGVLSAVFIGGYKFTFLPLADDFGLGVSKEVTNLNGKIDDLNSKLATENLKFTEEVNKTNQLSGKTKTLDGNNKQLRIDLDKTNLLLSDTEKQLKKIKEGKDISVKLSKEKLNKELKAAKLPLEKELTKIRKDYSKLEKLVREYKNSEKDYLTNISGLEATIFSMKESNIVVVKDANGIKPDLANTGVYVFYSDIKAKIASNLKKDLQKLGAADITFDEGVPTDSKPEVVYYKYEAHFDTAVQLLEYLGSEYGFSRVQKNNWTNSSIYNENDQIQLIVN